MILNSWPKAVGSYKGQSATLTWTLDQPVSTTWRSVEFFYNKTKAMTVCTVYTSDPDVPYCSQEYSHSRATVDIKVGFESISLTINGLQEDDITYNYSCKVNVTPKVFVFNSESWILLFGMYLLRN